MVYYICDMKNKIPDDIILVRYWGMKKYNFVPTNMKDYDFYTSIKNTLGFASFKKDIACLVFKNSILKSLEL